MSASTSSTPLVERARRLVAESHRVPLRRAGEWEPAARDVVARVFNGGVDTDDALFVLLEDWHVRFHLFWLQPDILRARAERIPDRFRDALGDTGAEPGVRCAAAFVHGRFLREREGALELLVAAFRTAEDPEVRARALEAIAAFERRALVALPHVLATYDDPATLARGRETCSFGQITTRWKLLDAMLAIAPDDPDVIERLFNALDDDDPDVFLEAPARLVRSGADRAIVCQRFSAVLLAPRWSAPRRARLVERMSSFHPQEDLKSAVIKAIASLDIEDQSRSAPDLTAAHRSLDEARALAREVERRRRAWWHRLFSK